MAGLDMGGDYDAPTPAPKKKKDKQKDSPAMGLFYFHSFKHLVRNSCIIFCVI
jgi:hypothetical protein